MRQQTRDLDVSPTDFVVVNVLALFVGGALIELSRASESPVINATGEILGTALWVIGILGALVGLAVGAYARRLGE